MSRGPIELVEYFLIQKRDHVVNFFQKQDGDSKIESIPKYFVFDYGIHANDPLLSMMEAHLDYLSPHISNWSSALAILGNPANYPNESLIILGDVLDDFCRVADLKTARLDWYTERSLLLGVYGSAGIVWSNESS